MALEAIDLTTLEKLYTFVESALARTGLILDHDALHRPWARSVSSACPDVCWFYPAQPLTQVLLEHLGNFAHARLGDKAFVLIEHGRVVKAIDVDAVDGSSQPHRLAGIVQNAFKPKRQDSAIDRDFSGDPFALLGVLESDSDETIKHRYKQLIMEYHPDRVAHLGQELKDPAARKTTEINAAYAVIRRTRTL